MQQYILWVFTFRQPSLKSSNNSRAELHTVTAEFTKTILYTNFRRFM